MKLTSIPQETIDRCLAIRKAYRELEVKHHDKEWSIEEDLLALTNDIGNMNRLIMTKQGVTMMKRLIPWSIKWLKISGG